MMIFLRKWIFHHQIYPRVGDIVTRIQEKPVGEKMYRVRIKSIPKSTTIGVVDKVMFSS